MNVMKQNAGQNDAADDDWKSYSQKTKMTHAHYESEDNEAEKMMRIMIMMIIVGGIKKEKDGDRTVSVEMGKRRKEEEIDKKEMQIGLWSNLGKRWRQDEKKGRVK